MAEALVISDNGEQVFETISVYNQDNEQANAAGMDTLYKKL